MKQALGWGLALMLCGSAEAAEPAASPAGTVHKAPAVGEPADAKRKPAGKKAATATAAPTTATPTPRKQLDLRVRDVREYMTTEELAGIVTAPDPDKNTIVVEGTRLLPMEQIENVPLGIGALWYGVKHPTNAWRLLAPVVNVPPALLEKPNPVPPPIFRWGP